MHVLAFHEEGQWPYADILLTTKNAFEEALNQTNIIEQQCIILLAYLPITRHPS